MIPRKQDTPYVPISADEIVKDTCEAYKLGASVVHVHARDENGDPTHKKEIFNQIFKKHTNMTPSEYIKSREPVSGKVVSRHYLPDLYQSAG